MTFLLVIQSDDSPQRSFPLTGSTVTVGRNGDNDLVIDDPSVSGHQAVLTPDQGAAWVIKDMNSSNGTMINGVQIREAVARPGDTITFGGVVCNIQESVETPPPLPVTESAPPLQPATSGPGSPSPLPAQAVAGPKTRPRIIGTMLWGCLGTIVLFVGIIAIAGYTTVTGIEKNVKENAAPMLKDLIAKGLVNSKQQIFESIHPLGQATNLVVHEVDLRDKNGNETDKIPDIRSYTVRYTLYWEGPIRKDGFTKVEAVYDLESQRWIRSDLMATNGVKTDQFIENAFMIGIELGRLQE